MSLTPPKDEAINFLCKWRPSGPWVLTAIATEGVIITKTFHNVKVMSTWIDENNGRKNLYFTINPVQQDKDTKPKRTDISFIIAFQVDCDPRIGEDFQKERERIFKSLANFEPHPSVIIDSGGGAQAFWLLEEPITLDGTEPTAIEHEAYSVQLELLLGGDRTSNCDRIFRLPGTINIPNAVKLKKGRVLALTSVVEYAGTRYPLSKFTRAPIKIQAPIVKGTELLPGGGERVQISGNVAPIFVDDLQKRNVLVPDITKVLIIHGKDPENPDKYASRSEALWAVVCALVRADASDETIAGVILNRDNKISSSVLDKPRPERYAAKQIQDAREEVEDPMLRELNGKHAVISDIGGKCRIISETFDHALTRPRISYQSFLDFGNRYCNRKIEVAVDKNNNPVYKPMGKWWTDHAKRRQYECIVFAPGKEVPMAYNLWQGFACEAIPGACELYLDHMLQNICQKNEEHYKYLLSWMARCVQQPDCQGEVAIVLRGEMGTGKGALAKHFGALFGRHFLQISDAKHLVGNFNSHLRDAVVVFSDEAFWAGDKKHESVLKSLITENLLAIEGKGIDVVASPNYTHIIMASNSQWVVPAGNKERRFLVLDVGENKLQDKKYFAAIQQQMKKGGYEALLHLLLTYDISNFEVRDIPQTTALHDQKLLSMGAEEQWWYEKIVEGRILRDDDRWEDEVQKIELQNDYVNFMIRIGVQRKFSPTLLGKFLAKACPEGHPKSYQKLAKVTEIGQHGEQYSQMKRVYFYGMPSLQECRNIWDKQHGSKSNWNAPLEKDEQLEMKTSAEDAFK